jgi:SP family xylose:H+ symportor-like MFS transporter
MLVTCVAAMGGLLFGYDTAVISGAIGFVQSHFVLNAAETGWAASCALVGCIAGSALAGTISNRFGRRLLIVVAALLFLASAIGTAVAPGFSWFIVFRMIGGAGIGAASMASPLYIAEMAPTGWRGWLVGINQLAIVSGMLLIYFVNYRIVQMGSLSWNEAIGWRWMFASSAVPSVALLTFLTLVPETPRYLLSKGRRVEAIKVAERLGGFASIDEVLKIQDEVLREVQLPLLGRSTLPVLTIGIVLAVLQQITGINVFLYYAPEIFKHFGTETNTALLETVMVGAVNLLFTLVAMGSVDRVGRKPLLIFGSLGMGLCLVAIGLAALRESHDAWLLVVILGYIACFAVSVGPVTWVVLSEIFPIKIRGSALAVASVSLWAANFFVSQTFPMINESKFLVAHFHHALPFFLYASFCLVESLFVWKYIPETRNRSLEEIALSWAASPAKHNPKALKPD